MWLYRILRFFSILLVLFWFGVHVAGTTQEDLLENYNQWNGTTTSQLALWFALMFIIYIIIGEFVRIHLKKIWTLPYVFVTFFGVLSWWAHCVGYLYYAFTAFEGAGPNKFRSYSSGDGFMIIVGLVLFIGWFIDAFNAWKRYGSATVNQKAPFFYSLFVVLAYLIWSVIGTIIGFQKAWVRSGDYILAPTIHDSDLPQKLYFWDYYFFILGSILLASYLVQAPETKKQNLFMMITSGALIAILYIRVPDLLENTNFQCHNDFYCHTQRTILSAVFIILISSTINFFWYLIKFLRNSFWGGRDYQYIILYSLNIFCLLALVSFCCILAAREEFHRLTELGAGTHPRVVTWIRTMASIQIFISICTMLTAYFARTQKYSSVGADWAYFTCSLFGLFLWIGSVVSVAGNSLKQFSSNQSIYYLTCSATVKIADDIPCSMLKSACGVTIVLGICQIGWIFLSFRTWYESVTTYSTWHICQKIGLTSYIVIFIFYFIAAIGEISFILAAPLILQNNAGLLVYTSFDVISRILLVCMTITSAGLVTHIRMMARVSFLFSIVVSSYLVSHFLYWTNVVAQTSDIGPLSFPCVSTDEISCGSVKTVLAGISAIMILLFVSAVVFAFATLLAPPHEDTTSARPTIGMDDAEHGLRYDIHANPPRAKPPVKDNGFRQTMNNAMGNMMRYTGLWSAPKLPPGWMECSSHDGQPYYYNQNTNGTVWTVEDAWQQSEGVNTQLPPNWEEQVSSRGEVYYYNVQTCQTSWNIPYQ